MGKKKCVVPAHIIVWLVKGGFEWLTDFFFLFSKSYPQQITWFVVDFLIGFDTASSTLPDLTITHDEERGLRHVSGSFCLFTSLLSHYHVDDTEKPTPLLGGCGRAWKEVLSLTHQIWADPLRIWPDFFWPQMAVIGPNFLTRFQLDLVFLIGSAQIWLDNSERIQADLNRSEQILSI
jgi:hypothetical protein